MPDPRKVLGFQDIDPEYVTFKYDNTITYSASAAGGSTSVGLALTMASNGTVALAAANDMVIGKLIAVESDGFCSVQTEGFMTLPAGNGSTVTVGTKIVGALGAASAKGYIQTVAAAATPTAAEVNNINKARGFIVDNSTTTAVVVNLC